MELNKLFIVICSILLLFAISSFAATQHVYVDTNQQGKGIFNASDVNVTGNFYGNLVDGFKNANYSALYASVGWKLANFTAAYAAVAGTFQNESSAFKIANFTEAYDARTDRFQNANYTALAPSPSDLQNVSAVYNLANFTSNYDARADRFGNANYTAFEDNAFRNANFTTLLNGYLNAFWQLANFTTAINSMTPSFFNNENFTTRYDLRADRFLIANFTSQYDLRADRFGNENTTSFLLGWTNLTNYPSACPANTYISTLGDSVTCTATPDSYVFDGGDNITGRYNHTSGNYSFAENGTSCYGWSCEGQIYYNGSSLVIKVT